jgi:hypothetical protein
MHLISAGCRRGWQQYSDTDFPVTCFTRQEMQSIAQNLIEEC